MIGLKKALIEAGLMDESMGGRGRPTADMEELGRQLVASDPTRWQIKGISMSSATEDKPAAAVKVKISSPTAISDVPDQLRDEFASVAIALNKDGKAIDVGMKKVCNLCGNSLTYCPHSSPVVWVDFDHQAVVNFKPIKGR